ncbi:hypothetical protein [Methylocystis echinoides]|uniref:Uncharacterized protein n=1 Tax=Methylocystis echinoides TaxID=29468 RepID=A0A9W6GWS8_9HYPH|nr:hypothetical protein [Methylocystis echinoides]GLI94454.1 hypothetical protein LMG27198_34460 [Methylocystis echinoides]
MKTYLAGWATLALAASFGVQQAAAFDFPKLGVPEVLGGGGGAQPQTPGATADCPVIVAEEGGQMLRAPAGAEAAAVHHQVSIKEIARECIVEGDHVLIRVGVEGDAVLGPTGAPGTYGGTIRVALRKTHDDSILNSKNYRISATIPAGGARADFRLLAEPIAAPPSAKAQDDFEILVGFTEGSADVDKPPRAKKRRR